MNRPLALFTGFAMLLVGQASQLMPRALFRQDLRLWATGMSGALDAVGPLCKVLGGGLLLGLLLTTPRRAGWRERVVAPSLVALALWALAAPFRAGMAEILTAALLWVLWGLGSLWRQSGGSALTPGRVLGAGLLLVGLEGTLRRSTLGPAWSALSRECAPDPLRAFLLWSVLAAAVMVLGLALTFRKARWPLALLGSGLLTLVPLGLPRWQVPDAGPAPRDLVWLSGGPPYAKLGITFPVAWPSAAPKTLREAQDRAVLAGDDEAQFAVWQAVMTSRPLSLQLSPNDLGQQIWWAQDHGQPTEALLGYLSVKDEENQGQRLEVSGRLGTSTQPSVGLPLRLVTSTSGLQAVDRVTDLERYRRVMWHAQPDERRFFNLLPCPAAESVVTGKDGRFRFRYAQRGTWSLLAGVKSTEVNDDVPHWPPLEVHESISDLKMRFAARRVQDQPANLGLDAPLDSTVWMTSGTVVEKGSSVVLSDRALLRQDIDVRSRRGTLFRASVTVRVTGQPEAERERSLRLELRTGGNSFATATASTNQDEALGDVVVEQHRYEGRPIFQPRVETRKGWPKVLTAEIAIGPEQNVLELSLRASGLSAVEVDGFTLEEVQP